MSRNAEIFSRITDAEADGQMSLCYQHSSEKKHHLIRGCSKQSGVKKKSTSDPCGTYVGW